MKKIVAGIGIVALLGMAACSKTEQIITESENASVQTESDTTAAPESDGDMDFTYDYSEDIKADVDRAATDAASLQEELENIGKVTRKYTPLAKAAQTQTEMNISSKWFFVIWDTELNSLWSRISDLADPQTKEKLLADQRNWIGMKEEATLENIGFAEENGSMYPLLVNSFMEEITRNRAYILKLPT